MFDIDWYGLFAIEAPVAELFVRGTVIYLLLFLAMRVLPRRTIGTMSAADVLVVVMISETVGGGLYGKEGSISAGLVVAATVLFWAFVVDYVDYKFPRLRLAGGAALQLVVDGRLLRENMARQQITEDEVLSQLRQHGLASLREVAAAYLEPDGHISVIARGDPPLQPPRQTRAS